MRIFMLDFKKGQSILEYAILISVLCAVLLSMGAYMRRAAQSKLLVVQNQINKAVQ